MDSSAAELKMERRQAIDELERDHQAIHRLLDGLPDDQWSLPATVGDGDWSVKDLIGHLASWEEIALERVAAVLEGTPSRWRGDADDVNASAVRCVG